MHLRLRIPRPEKRSSKLESLKKMAKNKTGLTI